MVRGGRHENQKTQDASKENDQAEDEYAHGDEHEEEQQRQPARSLASGQLLGERLREHRESV